MISEQDKQAILNGVLARTNNNKKAKFILKSEHEANFNYPYLFLISDKDKCYTDWYNEHLNSKQDKFNSSIVELWQDEPEPFDLKRALAGEPVLIRDGSKGYVFANLNDIALKENMSCSDYLPLRGVIVYENNGKKLSSETWTLDGRTSSNGEEDYYDIIGMWKELEPVSNTVTLILPCPIKEPTGHKWYINSELDAPQYTNTDLYTKDFISKGCYFDTREDAQAWLDAMKNNRR